MLRRTFVLLLAASFLVKAQAATITGSVSGPDGRVAGARVVALQGDAPVAETVSDTSGNYVLPVPPASASSLHLYAEPPAGSGSGLMGERLQWLDLSFDRTVHLFIVREYTISGLIDLPGWMDASASVTLQRVDDFKAAVFPIFDGENFEARVPAGVYSLNVAPRCESPAQDLFFCPYFKYFANAGADARNGSVSGVHVPENTGPPELYPARPPVASLIQVGPSDSGGQAIVTGAPGATSGPVGVAIVNLQTGQFTYTGAAADGSFSAEMFAPPGSILSIHEESTAFSLSVGSVALLAGTTVSVPPAAAGNNDFATMVSLARNRERNGNIPSLGATDGGQIWLSGSLTSRDWSAGQALGINGIVRIYSRDVPLIDPGSVAVTGSVSLHRIFDPSGKQEIANPEFMSHTLTPSGLPIERTGINDAFKLADMSFGGLSSSSGRSLEGTWAASIQVPNDVPDGIYQLTFEVHAEGIPESEVHFEGVYHTLLAPLFPTSSVSQIRIGSVAPRRLSWMLGANDFSNGSRGTVAPEDQDSFQIAGHASTNSARFILPRDRARSVQRASYRLEPFVPLLGASNRGWINPPTIPFLFPSGALNVQITRPGGSLVDLGSAPFAQLFMQEPSSTSGPRLSPPSNQPGQYYGLTTLDPKFDVQFDDYGRHQISMTGTIEDVYGNIYSGGGTYDVYVARTLDLETGVFPSTPFEVGDSFSPTLIVQPGVSADVEVRVRQYPNSDPLQMIETVVVGKANRFGYFHPDQSILMQSPGEYRVDYSASFRDEHGVLWMGSATWGSVIATPTSPIVTHGKRGMDNGSVTTQWFTLESTGSHTGHMPFPYHGGDIMWMRDTHVDPTNTANVPALTLHDTLGEFSDMYLQRINALPDWNPLGGGGGFEQTYIIPGEIPLTSTTPTGISPIFQPDLSTTHWAYAYAGAARPGVRIREMVAELNPDNGYWRFNDTYNYQLGNGLNGDLTNDFKLQYLGAVYRAPDLGFYYYGAHGSMFVLVPPDDPMGVRVFPPFQGNAGGPDGGPIMTLLGQEIDAFLHLTGVRPGSILELGDRAAFSGAVAPTLPSGVAITITSPAGAVRQIDGFANVVGYFYEPTGDFLVDEPGKWKVRVLVTHNGQTSAGPTQPPYPTGHVLGTVAGEFHFYVVDPFSDRLEVNLPTTSMVEPARGPLQVSLVRPSDLENPRVHYIITMPGFLLEEGELPSFSYSYDATALHAQFPNLDLYDPEGFTGQDTVTMSFLVSGTDADGNPVHRSRQVLLQGEELILAAQRGASFIFANGFE